VVVATFSNLSIEGLLPDFQFPLLVENLPLLGDRFGFRNALRQSGAKREAVRLRLILAGLAEFSVWT
jgi:hypothetical protein